ncbi:carbonic anhydrase [Rickettsiaceae bacterium]|nr:carbonic anhydrase [Rickettsiaceae bacterium]
MNLPSNPRLLSFLRELFDTNTEFASSHDDNFFAKFQDKQTPKLTILKCSDSRVQMESFDKTPQNGVFAIRNIGNQIVNNEGSVDYGVQVLKTPFLLIIGHSGCGAVEAALSSKPTNIPSIDSELSVMQLKSTCEKDAIIENVNSQIAYAVKKYQALIDSDQLTIIGAVYDFKNDFEFGHGRVVLTNVNGITDKSKINEQYLSDIPDLHFL